METLEQAEKNLAAAQELYARREAEWNDQKIEYTKLDAARQEVEFRAGLLTATRAREAKRQAEAADAARIEKAHKDRDELVAFYGSALTELEGEHSNVFRAMVSLLTTYNMHNAARRDAHRGVDWRALDEIAPVAGVNRGQQDLKGPDALIALMQRAIASTGQTSPLASYELAHGRFPDHIDAIERQRDTIIGNKTPSPELVANNGGVSTKGSAK